jgi:hypothetical protein
VFELRKQGHFRGLNAKQGIALTLTYTLKEKHIKDFVPLTNTPCYFGGVRWWFKCPSCKKRVALLYKPYYADYFRCRHCYDLTYLSRRLRGNFLEPICRILDLNRKFLKLREGKGQKGYSKVERTQIQKLVTIFKKLGHNVDSSRKGGTKC